jgi:hypothetical protein
MLNKLYPLSNPLAFWVAVGLIIIGLYFAKRFDDRRDKSYDDKEPK